MRILFLNHNVRGAGTFQRAFHLARGLVAVGHEVTLVTTSRTRRFGTEEQIEFGVRVIEAPDLLWGRLRNGWDPWNASARIARLRGLRFDIVHAFDSRPVVLLPLIAIRRRTGVRTVMDWADWWGRGGRISERSGWFVRTFWGPVETWLEEVYRARTDGATVICGPLEVRWRTLTSSDAPLLKFPNGCDLASLKVIPRAEARLALGLCADAPLVGHLGILTKRDLRLLSDGFELATTQFPELQLALVGSPGVPLPAPLTGSGRVHLPGRVSTEDLNIWLSACDLCVCPLEDTIGNRGRWPGKVNDYMSVGKPTLITDVGDVGQLIRTEGIGWVSEPDSVSFGGSMIEALRDPDLIEQRGARARRVAETTMSWQTQVAQADDFYRMILERAGGEPKTN